MLAIRTLLVAVVGIIAIWIAGFFYAPEKTKILYGQLRKQIEFVLSPECNVEPVTCQIRRTQNLERSKKSLGRAIASIDVGISEADDLVVQNRQLLAKNRLYLSEGRKILRTAPANSPLRFIGTDYPSGEKLREQLKLLFREGRAIEEVLASSEAQSRKLKNMRLDAKAQLSEVMATLAGMPARIELAKGNGDTATLARDLMEIDELLNESEEVEKHLRSTKRLSVDEARASVRNEDIPKWLAGDDQ